MPAADVLNRSKKDFLLTGPNSTNLFHSGRVGRAGGNLYHKPLRLNVPPLSQWRWRRRSSSSGREPLHRKPPERRGSCGSSKRASCPALSYSVASLEGAVRYGCSNLQHHMCSPRRPAHLLIRGHPAMKEPLHGAFFGHSGTFHRHSCINAAQRRHAREFDTRMPAAGRAAFRRITIRVPDTASRIGSGANASWLGPHQSVSSLTQLPRSSSRCSAGAGMLPQQQTHRTT
jgi:hypothetical protein